MLAIYGNKIITDRKSTDFVCMLDKKEIEKIYKTVEKKYNSDTANNAICGRINDLEEDFSVIYVGG